MSDRDLLDKALGEIAAGTRIAYLGPEVAALSGGGAPTTPGQLCAIIEAQVRAPRRATGNLWAVAQYVESRKFRATLDKMVRDAFDTPSERANPVYDWLARVRAPLVVDAWYGDDLRRAFDAATTGSKDWGLVQGVSRNGEWIDIFTRAYDRSGTEIDAADPEWQTLIYKPHGTAVEGRSFLMSDADYVEVLTEIDIQRPIPEEVQHRRTGLPFLFVGCRFDDQMLRIFARQITKRSAAGHIAVLPGPLTRMEQKFLDELNIIRLDLPVAAVAEMIELGQTEPG